MAKATHSPESPESESLLKLIVNRGSIEFDNEREGAWIEVIRKMDEVYSDLLRYEVDLERKNAELEEAQAFVTNVIESVSDVLIVCDGRGLIQQVNSAFHNALGRTADDITGNATAKEALLAEAEQIDLSDPDAARARLRNIQQRWEAIGKVPRQRIREFEDRMRAAEQRVKDVADAQWRRADPETQARVDQFRARVEQYAAQAAKARAAGDTRRAEEAESQAKQWREWLATAEQAVNRR